MMKVLLYRSLNESSQVESVSLEEAEGECSLCLINHQRKKIDILLTPMAASIKIGSFPGCLSCRTALQALVLAPKSSHIRLRLLFM